MPEGSQHTTTVGITEYARMQALVAILEIIDSSKNDLDLKRALNQVADIIVKCYEGDYITIVFAEKDHFNLIAQRGFQMTDNELERMINTDPSFLKPYELMKKPLFIDDYISNPRENSSVVEDSRLAYIPMLSLDEVIGWLTISSKEKVGWTSEERAWLPLVGRQCGALVNAIHIIDARTSRVLKEKNALAKDIHAAISEVLGESVSNEQSKHSDNESVEWEKRIAALSSREKEVLLKVSEGATNPEIADELKIAISTVKKHLESILKKLKIKNRVQIAIEAQKYGIPR